MKRRTFFSWLGRGAVAVAVAPLLKLLPKKPVLWAQNEFPTFTMYPPDDVFRRVYRRWPK